MGTNSVSEPGSLADYLSAYLRHVVGQQTAASDGRWLAQTIGARGRTYWAERMNGAKAMNTNDVEIVAEAFGITSWEFFEYARLHGLGEDTPELNVVGHPEDYEQSEDPGDYALASKKRKPRTPRA